MQYPDQRTPDARRDGNTQALRVDPRVEVILYSFIAGMVALATVAILVSHVI